MIVMTTRNIRRWIEPAPISAQTLHTLQALVGGNPLVSTVLAQRGLTDPNAVRAFLDADEYAPALPEDLPDLVRAAGHLQRAVARGETVLVWGDFDVDGQTATAVLVDGLRQLGARVAYYIPHRLRESHGIPLTSLQVQLAKLQPSLLLTCDTGVAAHPAIDYAKSQGLTVVVTDHHDLPPALPHADAVVNPKRLPPDHPLASLPGVGVAYKLMQFLFTQHGRTDELRRFLDLVALGIVADVATQTHDTRYLLQRGMHALRHTQRIGLQALFDVAEIAPEHITTDDIAFQIGPRLNAAGRMDDANPVVELFTTEDRTRAHVLALTLEGLNNQRRLQNRQIYAAAQELIANDPALLDWEALVIAHANWHPGIIGIVASRLAEQYHRPVVLLSIGDEGIARGSARSAPGYDIGAAIAAQADLLIEHGGHPGAAGLSIHENHIPAFRRRLSDTLRATRDPDAQIGVQIDAFADLADTTLDLAADLRRLAPFGEGNPPVTLATCDLMLKSAALIGRTREHRRLTVADKHGNTRQVLWWNSADHVLPDGPFDLAYHIDISVYSGDPELQLTLIDFRRAQSAPPPIERQPRAVIDHRATLTPAVDLHDILARYPDAAIWAEGYPRAESPGVPLADLHPAPALVIYTTPSGPQALQQALERVKPNIIALFAINPPLQTLSAVQRRVLELAKYIINHQDGATTLNALTGALGHSFATIRAALDLAEARGDLRISYQRADRVALARGTGIITDSATDALDALRASLAETAAYRAYFQRAQAYDVLGENSST